MALPDKYLFLPDYWFFGLDSIFEFTFFLITLAICFKAYKVYKLSHNHNAKYFWYGFSLISLSYFIKSLTNLSAHSVIRGHGFTPAVAKDTLLYFAWGYYAYLILIMIGLLFISFIALQNPNRRTRYLVALLVIALSFQSYHKVLNYYVTTTIFLLIICYHYLKSYQAKKSKNTLLVGAGFGCLLLGHLTFALMETHILYYVTGHLLELLAYLMLLMNLLMVTWYTKKHGKKA